MARARRPPAPKPKGGKARDYAAEYRRRVERAEMLGLTRSVARGHAKSGELGLAELRQLRRAAQIQSRGGFQRKKAAAIVAERAGVGAEVTEGWKAKKRGTAVERFVEEFLRLGLGTEQEAYTLWFSP